MPTVHDPGWKPDLPSFQLGIGFIAFSIYNKGTFYFFVFLMVLLSCFTFVLILSIFIFYRSHSILWCGYVVLLFI